MSFSKEILELRALLESKGHTVIIPRFTEEYTKLSSSVLATSEAAKNKITFDLIKGYFEAINSSDVIFVLNKTKNGVEIISEATFLEMGFVHVLGKQIFLLNPIPEMQYTDEIIAMKPKVLTADLNLRINAITSIRLLENRQVNC